MISYDRFQANEWDFINYKFVFYRIIYYKMIQLCSFLNKL